MSSKYQKPFIIPSGFPELLKGFTREILRAQPDNIYEFGVAYFGDLLSASAPNDDKPDISYYPSVGDDLGVQNVACAIDVTKLSSAELEPIIMELFLAADADSSGYLDRQEFAHVLKSANLHLNERQIREVLAEADENADNVIEYKEFLPVMVDIIHGFRATAEAQAMMGKAEDMVRNAVEDMMVHGMTKEELESLMQRVFVKADADGSGQLDRNEFRAALKAAKLGLTRKDINLIMSSADTNNDGLVSYDEFIPVCFQILVERFKDEIVANDVLQNQDGIQQLLLQAFQSADASGSGYLPQSHVKKILEDLSYQSLGLSALQLITLLCQAPTTPEGEVQYIQFVPIAASIIYSMYDVDAIKLRIQAVKQASDAGGIQALSGLDVGTLRSVLDELFKEADVEGTGRLTMPEVVSVLDQLGTSDKVKLTEMHMRAMFTAIDSDESGYVDWFEMVGFICDAMEHIEREAYIRSISAQ